MKYDDHFFDWVRKTARRSARVVLPVLQRQIHPGSVLDVGCGQGAWLETWDQLGVVDYLGLDGDHVNRDKLLISSSYFQATDLTSPWNCGRQFDLVQSLEVAEHLPPATAERFVDCLCAHGDVIVFSAAQPGQGGEDHINERPPSYWAKLFQKRGYLAYDSVRPAVAKADSVDPWYKFNTILYATPLAAPRLTQEVIATKVTDLRRLDQSGDLGWYLRRTLLRPLPTGLVSALSRLHYQLAIRLEPSKSDR